MMKSNIGLEMQRERLNEVLDILKKRGVTQKTICDELICDESYLSSLKSGKVKKIPDKVLDVLQKVGGINPAYIRLESDYVFFALGKPFEHFEKFVSSWETVKHDDCSYLYLTMDRNFYDYLLEVDKAKLASDSIEVDEKELIKIIEPLYDGAPRPQKFVILPCDDCTEIIESAKENRKKLAEVIDLIAIGKQDEISTAQDQK